MPLFRKVIFSFFILGFFFPGKSQNIRKIDSLRKVTLSSAQDTIRISAYNALAKEYWLFKPDSALPILKTAYSMAEKIGHKRLISGTLLFEAYSYGTLEKYDSAIIIYEKCLEVSRKNGFYKNMGQALTGIGNIYNSSGDYTKALPYYIESLKSLEKVKDSAAIAQTYNSLGSLFESQGDYKQSLNYHFKALAIKLKKSSKMAIAMSYNNIGIVYSDLKEYEKSLEYHNKALALRKEVNNLIGIASSYINIGNNYSKLNDLNEAIKYQKNAYALYLQLNDQYGITTSALNIGTEYGKMKKYDLAKSYLLTAESKIHKLNYKELELSIYNSLYDLYSNTGDYKKAFEYTLEYMHLKDSVFNVSKAAELNKLNTVYQTEKKEQENKLLQKQNELSVKTIKQQKLISYFILAALMLALSVAVLIFRGYRQKQKANIIITKQKEEVELQKEIIEEKNKEIMDSIYYARRIQRSLLTSEKYIERVIKKLRKKD
ncbi:MAG TPA: tetratricopeptide repeat protein [Bacteroidia bacterium]|jgi:tetratricopeptide (TPR) repeat protein|nr:tetratricopeptide repeat protein [Bacteroidia bacterium]